MNAVNKTILKTLSKKIKQESSQILLVMNDDPASSLAKIYPLERRKAEWTLVLKPVEATIGRNGIALPGEKAEGDDKTPSGIYPLELTFGYATEIHTKMNYRQATEGDIWVDDLNSVDYNKWVRKGETKAESYEEMRRTDALYKYGIVVGYNTNPVVKGKGSAIFFHVRAGDRTPTSGCVAMSEEDIVAILGWLEPSQRPLAVMGTKGTLE